MPNQAGTDLALVPSIGLDVPSVGRSGDERYLATPPRTPDLVRALRTLRVGTRRVLFPPNPFRSIS